MKEPCLPPSCRVFLRGMLLGALLVLLVTGLPLRWSELGVAGPLLVFGPVVLLIVVTRPPRVEPDWAAIAARHTRLASGLVVVGYCVGILGAVALLGLALASYWSSVGPGSPLFWVAFGGMLAGFVVMSLGESIKRAAKKGEAGR